MSSESGLVISAFDRAPVALCELDAHGSVQLGNECLQALIGEPVTRRSVDDVLPCLWARLAQLGAHERLDAVLALALAFGSRAVRVLAQRTAGGFALALLEPDPAATQHAAAQALLEHSRIALASAGQWVWDYDMRADRVWRSPEWKLALGFGPDELTGDEEPWAIVHPDDREAIDTAMRPLLAGAGDVFEATYRLQHKDGTWRYFLSRGKVIERTPDGRPARILATSTDISRQKEIERQLQATLDQRARLERDLVQANERLRRLAEIDSLTALPNRRMFDRELKRASRKARSAGLTLALLMVDIDYFKSFNDLYGHPAGDRCLKAVAGALRAVARRDGDIVARYGGEEFAVILADITDGAAIEAARRMMRAVRRLAIDHRDSPFGTVTISAGIALYHGESEPLILPHQLVQASDIALYAAKAAGRGQIALAQRRDGGIETGLVGTE